MPRQILNSSINVMTQKRAQAYLSRSRATRYLSSVIGHNNSHDMKNDFNLKPNCGFRGDSCVTRERVGDRRRKPVRPLAIYHFNFLFYRHVRIDRVELPATLVSREIAKAVLRFFERKNIPKICGTQFARTREEQRPKIFVRENKYQLLAIGSSRGRRA